MRVPGQGDDCLEVDQEFVISLYGTDSVFTANGEDLRVRPFTNTPDQVWRCIRDNKYRYGFINRATGRFLGRDRWTNLGASAPHHQAWEWLTFTKLCTGGYELTVVLEDSTLQPVECHADEGGNFMKVVPHSSQAVGLHVYSSRPFQNFRWVIPGRLARSAAPHYRSEDHEQHMDAGAVEYLARQGITSIVSVNSICLPPDAICRLNERGISYDHIPVPDYCPPDLEQLRHLNEIYINQRCVLVFCGFGDGRTATAVCALQMYGNRYLSDADFKASGVDTHDQMAVLRHHRSMLRIEE